MMDSPPGLTNPFFAKMDLSCPPDHLTEMNLATTPLQFFEHADRLLLEAAKVKDFSDELCQRSHLMYVRASQLRETASELQRMGVQDRAHISKSYERILQEHEDNLSEYKLAKPWVVEELSLAVEEGRVLLEEVDAFGHKLQNFTRSDTSLASDCSSDEDVESVSETGSTSADVQKDVVETTDLTNTAEELVENADIASNPKFEPSEQYHDQFVTNSDHSSDKFYHAVAVANEKVDTVSVALKMTSARGKRAPESDCRSSDIDEAPTPKRARRRTSRKVRKTGLLHRMGYEDADISEILLNSVKTPPRKIGRFGRKNKAKKNKKIIPYNESNEC